MTRRPIRDALLLTALGACSGETSNTPTPPRDAARPDVAADAPEDAAPAEDVAPTPDAAPASGIGDPCESEEMFGQGTCRSGQICLTERLGFNGGYCVQVCAGSTRCPSDAACASLQGYPVCLRRCASNMDCRGDQGYVCGAGNTSAQRVCRVNDEPVGQRADGTACFTTTPGDHALAALPRRAFAGANTSVSAARGDSFVEAEGNVAVNPMNGNVANAYIAAGGSGAVFMGVSFSASAGATWDGWANVYDPLGSASDPVLDYGRDGTLRMTYIGLQRTSLGQVQRSTIRITESADGGRNWATPRQVEPTNFCNQGGICDKPWLLSGPGTAAGSEALYLAYLQQTRSTADVVVQRSDDGGRTWSDPAVIGRAGTFGAVTIPNLVQIATGAAGGAVAASWIGISAGMGAGMDGAVRFGSPDNRVFFRRTADGFRTLDSSRVVSRVDDSPVYTQAPVALDGDRVHVAYVSGSPSGAWDLVLATSADGGATWRYRKVNDEPETCATHALPAMVVDRTTHDVHLVWMENRFGEGAVAYARCPADPARPCGANEAVSDRPFRFTTGRNPMTWHGDYLGLAISPSGDLWATWSDTRAGAPAMYVARGRGRI